MKQLYKYILIRSLQIIALYFFIIILTKDYPVLGYVVFNILGVIIVFYSCFHRGTNINIQDRGKNILIYFNFLITLLDSIFFVFLINYIEIIIVNILISKSIKFSIEQIFLGKEVFINYNKSKKFNIYPLNVAVELRWILVIFIGRLSQKYFKNTFLEQKTLINTSYLFRDFSAYNEKIISYNHNHRKTLSILVAGCATGQEAYSISALCEKNNIPVSIVAFDLSQEAISVAEKGEFNLHNEKAFILRSQNIQALDYLENYINLFQINGDIAIAKDAIKRNIEFLVQDIAEISYQSKFDFVFARRMLYYLPKDKVRTTIIKLKDALIPENYPDNLIIDDFTKQQYKSFI